MLGSGSNWRGRLCVPSKDEAFALGPQTAQHTFCSVPPHNTGATERRSDGANPREPLWEARPLRRHGHPHAYNTQAHTHTHTHTSLPTKVQARGHRVPYSQVLFPLRSHDTLDDVIIGPRKEAHRALVAHPDLFPALLELPVAPQLSHWRAKCCSSSSSEDP